jgi:hypothetical protein
MSFTSKIVRFAAVGALLAALTAVAGCRKEEQGRPLTYEPGKYQGKPDQKLTEAQEQELRSRARNQAN